MRSKVPPAIVIAPPAIVIALVATSPDLPSGVPVRSETLVAPVAASALRSTTLVAPVATSALRSKTLVAPVAIVIALVATLAV